MENDNGSVDPNAPVDDAKLEENLADGVGTAGDIAEGKDLTDEDII